MLCEIHNSYSIEYFFISKKKLISFRLNENHVLLNTINDFKLDRLKFQLKFEIFEKKIYDNYINTRNNIFMKVLNLMSFYTRLHVVLKNYKRLIKNVILYDIISNKTFKLIHAIVDIRIDDSLIMKKLIIKNKYIAKISKIIIKFKVVTFFSINFNNFCIILNFFIKRW